MQRSQIRIGLAVVGHRRHQPGLQGLHGHGVLDAHAHGVAGQALGVGHDDVGGRVAEDRAQGVHLRRGAAAARRGVGLVGDEEELPGQLPAVEAEALLGLGDQPLHHALDVVDVEPRAVEGAVGRDRGEHLADRAQPPLPGAVRVLDHEGRRAHSEDHAVAAAVEGQRRLLDHLVRGRGARGQEPGADPLQHAIGGDVVGSHHQHAAAATRADPVLRHGEGLGGAGAGGVDLGVGAPGADVLGELGVTHRQDAEQEAAIEVVRMGGDLVAHRVDAVLELRAQHLAAAGAVVQARAQGLEGLELAVAGVVLLVAGDLVGEGIVAREDGSEDHPRLVAQRLGQHPALGDLRPLAGRAVVHGQGQAGVAQGVETRADGQARGHVEGLDALGGQTELRLDVEVAGPGRQLDGLLRPVDGLEVGALGLALHQPGDVLVHHGPAEAAGDDVDALLAVQDPSRVVVVEDPVVARQAEGGARDHRRLRRRRGCCTLHEPGAALQELGEEPTQLDVARLRHRGGRSGSHGGRCRDGRGRDRRRRRALGRRLDAATEPGGVEPAQGVVEGGQVARLGVVAEETDHVVPASEDVVGESVQRGFGADLHEHPRALGVEGLEPLHELHGRGHLGGQQVEHRLDGVGSAGVELAVHVAHQRDARRCQAQAGEGAAQGLAGRGHDGRVEGVTHRQHHRLHVALAEHRHRGVHRVAGAADDGLAVAVEVGDDDVARDGFDDLAHGLEGAEDRRHLAVVGHVDAGHLAPAGAHRQQRVLEGQGPRRHQGAVLAQTVTHDQVRGHAVGLQQPRQGGVHGEDRGLGDLGAAQGGLGVGACLLVVAVHEDDLRERPLEQGRHHPVRLAEDLGHPRLLLAEVPEHVGVLGALSRVEEGHASRRPPTAMDPLGADGAPHRRLVAVQGLAGALGPGGQLGGVAEVDGEPLGRAQVGRLGRGRRRGATGPGLGDQGVEALAQGRGALGPEHRCPAQGRLELGQVDGPLGTAAGDGDRGPPLGEASGHVLLQDRVEVGAAEAEGAQAGRAHAPGRGLPGLGLRVHEEGRLAPVDVRVGRLRVEARRQHLLVEGQGDLQQAGGAGGPLQVSDVRLHRAQGHRTRTQALAAEDGVQALHLDHVAHPGGRAVTLHQAHVGRRDAARAPGALDGQALAPRVRRRDALAAPVARATDPADHGVDPVARLLGVRQALEHEEGDALAHHEAVGTVGVGARAGGRERADLAELHEGGGAHVAVDAAREHRVVLVLHKALGGRVDGGQGRCAGGVADEVGAVEVEEVGDPPGHAVGELAGHGVLGDGRQALADLLAELLEHRATRRLRERAEGGGALQGRRVLRELDPHRRLVVALAGHGVADHAGRAFEVEGSLRVPGVEERGPRTGHRPLLGDVHGVGDLRRHRKPPAHGVPGPVADPAPDPGVGAVDGGRIRVVVAVRVPSRRIHVADAVAAFDEVAPEGGGVGGVGQDGAHSDDGDGTASSVFHVPPGSERAKRSRCDPYAGYRP